MNVLPAVVGALIAGISAFLAAQYQKNRERSTYLFDQYLNRLKMANEEVFIRFNELLHRKVENTLSVIEIDEYDELDKRDAVWYNEFGSFFGTTCYFVCWLFFYIDKIRREIPHFAIRGVKSTELMSSIFDLQYAFLRNTGIFYGIQMSIGREMEGANTTNISYREFCEKLMDAKSRVWLKRVVYFILDFKKGNRFEQFAEIQQKSYELGILLDKITKSKGTMEARLGRESYGKFDALSINENE